MSRIEIDGNRVGERERDGVIYSQFVLRVEISSQTEINLAKREPALIPFSQNCFHTDCTHQIKLLFKYSPPFPFIIWYFMSGDPSVNKHNSSLEGFSYIVVLILNVD